MTTQFAVTLRLIVKGPGRRTHFQQVTDCYAKLEIQHEGLLDSSWGLADDDDHGHVDVKLTVAAPDDTAAWSIASSAVRTAIHDASGCTPEWDERTDDLASVVYRLTDEDVALV